jgi:hypothetical protein
MGRRERRCDEVIDALVDGERVDADLLKAALSKAQGRDYLVDVLALRGLLADVASTSQSKAAEKAPRTGRPSRRHRRWEQGDIP